jgi:3-hydroxybutyryl-CoA dehydrogenase
MTDVTSIAVIGAGTMGSGIALTAASSGIDVIQVDVSKEQLDRAATYHRKTLDRNVQKERMTQDQADAVMGRITATTQIEDSSEAQWAIEAATENASLKTAIFAEMASCYGGDVVLATNTSSISITEIASTIPEAADRVIGMHFFNPVPVMKLVEVINGSQTSASTTQRTIDLATAMGKTPIPANDFAGFVSNRVLMPMINEAFFAWQDGVADPEAIDGIMKLGCNFPMGPLQLADHIGLDVCRDIMLVMHQGLGQEKYLPCQRLVELVESGKLGKKSGHGVFDYSQ